MSGDIPRQHAWYIFGTVHIASSKVNRNVPLKSKHMLSCTASTFNHIFDQYTYPKSVDVGFYFLPSTV